MKLALRQFFTRRKGLTHQQVVSAVLKGLERGRKDFGIASGLIICAMRNMDVSLEMAELAVDFRERGVVGFDLAGEEGGYPPKKHVDAFHYIQRENFNITIHAGEGYGKESIWQAIQYCGAHRIGHGTRLIDDIAVVDGKAVKLGDLAQYVLDKRIPLEICLLSNVHTGATPSLAEHPFKILYQEKFRVTLNTDNRLMSSTTMTQEFEAAAETFGLTFGRFRKDHYQCDEERFSALRSALRFHLLEDQAWLCEDSQVCHTPVTPAITWQITGKAPPEFPRAPAFLGRYLLAMHIRRDDDCIRCGRG